MSSSRTIRPGALCIAVLLLGFPASARGSGPAPDDPAKAVPPGSSDPNAVKTAAAAAFEEGRSAFEAGDFAAAVTAFERAQSLSPHPATAYNLAAALERAGDDLAAWTMFFELEASASDAKRKEEAAQRRLQIESRIAVLRVITSPDARVCLDGERLRVPSSDDPANAEQAHADHVQPLRPGTHFVQIDARTSELQLVAGETRVVHLPAKVSPKQRRRRRAVLGLGASSVFAGFGAGALAATSALTPTDNMQRGLAWGSAGAALTSVALGTTALALHMRRHRSGKRRSSSRRVDDTPACVAVPTAD